MLVRPLLDDRLDVIGDVHGEVDALRQLLARLGCDVERARVDRPLVFVGDLVDRGPDSVAVLEIVQSLVEAGVAQVVLGNHELNLLLGAEKEGNGWFSPHASGPDGFHERGARVLFASRQATPEERARIRTFLQSLPFALESPALRVVHAAWSPQAITQARDAADLDALLLLRTPNAGNEDLSDAPTHEALHDPARPVAFHAGLAAHQLRDQLSQPAKVLTSGVERFIPAGAAPGFIGAKWRMLERDRWWEHDADARPVVFGHYWRRRPGASLAGKPDVLDAYDPLAWFGDRGQAFCVDYSVGHRYKARQRGLDPHANCGLAALRLPERVLYFDDLPAPLATR